ncbi:MAG TPA: hypothetical protein VFG10_20895 [Saprospiraceae bacterium]|nr:hypothetical protein [Saprospiraceae bacterium]
MRNLIILFFLVSVVHLNAQVDKPMSGTTDSSATIFLKSDYQDIWKNHFQYTLFESKSLAPTPSTFLMSCMPNHLPGMFCKMEYKIEAKSKLAPRFRLGSLNYTNWMEGKTPLYMRYLN